MIDAIGVGKFSVIPAGDTIGDYQGERSQVTATSPEAAVLVMAQRDFKQFLSAEDSYDVYTFAKKPALVGTYPCPPADQLVDRVLPATPMKSCGCGSDACEHSKPVTDKEAAVVALLVAEGVQDPVALAKRIQEVYS